MAFPHGRVKVFACSFWQFRNGACLQFLSIILSLNFLFKKMFILQIHTTGFIPLKSFLTQFHLPPPFLNLATQIFNSLLRISSFSLLISLVILFGFLGGPSRRALFLDTLFCSLHSKHAILFSIAQLAIDCN